MKKIIFVCTLMVSVITAMEKSKSMHQPLVEHRHLSADVEAGLAAYQDFMEHTPSYVILADDLKSIFPQLFEHIPPNLQQSIAKYVAYTYHEKNLLSALSKLIYSEFALRNFKWKALGYHFGLMPFYNFDQGYFYFEQPIRAKGNPGILKGARDDKSVKALLELDEVAKKLALSRDPKREEFLKMIKNEWHDVADSLVTEYKIHLMPQGDPTPTIVTLLTLLKNDPELQNLIAAFKVMATDKFVVNGAYYPRIVIYPTKGKENTQKALNKLYAGLKDIKGLGISPRYNAKVNDLIWVAQGDSAYKNQSRYQPYFEKPSLAYFNPDLTGKSQNYHLIHPETGKEIV